MLKNLVIFSMLFLIGCTADNENLINVPTSTLSDVEASEFSSSMLLEVNALRTQGCQCGNTLMPVVKELSWNTDLTAAADRHAFDMNTNNFFNHTGSDDSKVGNRTHDAGYAWQIVGENIALINSDIKSVIDGWKNSPEHCKQLMNPDFQEMGAAQRGDYWVQVFGTAVGE